MVALEQSELTGPVLVMKQNFTAGTSEVRTTINENKNFNYQEGIDF